MLRPYKAERRVGEYGIATYVKGGIGMEAFSWIPLMTIGITIGSIVLSVGIVFWAMAAVRGGERRRQALLANGEPAEATVISTNYTGVRVNGRMQIASKLEVRRPGHTPYQTTTRYFLDGQLFSTTPVYPPGTVVQVRVNPAKPQEVAIVGLAGNGLFQVEAIQPGQVTSAQMFVVDGKQYSNVADLPPHAQQAVERMGGLLGDSNKNGIPDMFEGQGATTRSPSDRLAELNRMREQGLINEQEYERKREAILSEL
jgi:hypothetical protein